jgi:MoaA/NifB/PqqE/SkfB family radical SAM enzyme
MTVSRCKCSQDRSSKRIGDSEILSQTEIKKVIDEFASAGIKNIFFLGGEPFQRKT